MKAFAVRPGVPDSAQVVDMPVPSPGPGEVLIRVLEVGICGTDAEINAGLYGEAPPGEELLVLGHEALGRLEGGGLVVPMVRRPCSECACCRRGDQDMCSSGAFTERGIKGVHGTLREYFTEIPELLIPVPRRARSFAVLLEPMSVVSKALRHALLIQRRLKWEPSRALVLGAGPIGLLATLMLRSLGWSVTTVARRPPESRKARLACGAGAKYVSVRRTPLAELARSGAAYDFIFEATGSAQAAFESLPALAVNGVLCLNSITGGDSKVLLPVDRMNCDLVLGNRLIFGSVNANKQDFTDGLDHLERIKKMFPGALSGLITARASFETALDVFNPQEDSIKTLFEIP